jgi:CRP-like cAMP-binding protein
MESALRAEDLAEVALFGGLEAEELELFLRDHRLLHLSAAQQPIFEGDWSDGIFLIRSGLAKVRHITIAGEEVVIGVMGAGDLFGELSLLLGDGRRSADVLSLTPMEVVKLRSAAIEAATQRLPGFGMRLARFEARRLVKLGRRFGLRGEDATTRVLATLLELALCNSRQKDPQAPIPDLNQGEIATIAGLARGTTSRVINQLRARGTISETPEGLRIVALEPLRRRGLLETEV